MPDSKDVSSAIADLHHRSLAVFPGDLAKLLYLSSLRDLSSGEYHHMGLEFEFGDEVARAALAACHREIFDGLALSSIEDLTAEIERYIEVTGNSASSVIETWRQLHPYRMTIPAGVDSLSADLFVSNIRIALEILNSRLPDRPD